MNGYYSMAFYRCSKKNYKDEFVIWNKKKKKDYDFFLY